MPSKSFASPVLHKATNVLRTQKLDYTAIHEHPGLSLRQNTTDIWLVCLWAAKPRGSPPHTFQQHAPNVQLKRTASTANNPKTRAQLTLPQRRTGLTDLLLAGKRHEHRRQ